jgi:hypothetical protein
MQTRLIYKSIKIGLANEPAKHSPIVIILGIHNQSEKDEVSVKSCTHWQPHPQPKTNHMINHPYMIASTSAVPKLVQIGWTAAFVIETMSYLYPLAN